jgi:hypothetical protein
LIWLFLAAPDNSAPGAFAAHSRRITSRRACAVVDDAALAGNSALLGELGGGQARDAILAREGEMPPWRDGRFLVAQTPRGSRRSVSSI